MKIIKYKQPGLAIIFLNKTYRVLEIKILLIIYIWT